MSNQPLISVIVPVYNVEDYLDQCLESIVAQSYRRLEILMVDDGSTDGSGALCDRWAERDERIRVIHQPNGGLSAARNTALDAMTGEGVIMVDSDDLLHPDAIAILLEALNKCHSDLAVADQLIFPENQAPQWSALTLDGCRYHAHNQQEAITAVFYQQWLTQSACGRLFSASLFDGIRFPVGQLYEDLAIIYPLLKKCGRVVKIDQSLYGYRQRGGSILHDFSPRRADVLKICEELEAHTLAHDTQYSKAVQSRLLSAYFNILLLSSHDKGNAHDELKDHCWEGIKRLRLQCLTDNSVRLKNKLGILVSYLGRGFLCSVIGRHYNP